MPEDEESEELVEDAADSEATEEEDETGEAGDFVVEQRQRAVEELSDTAESSPSARHDYDADADPLVDAAPATSAPQAKKRTTGAFAEEDYLFSS